MNAKLYVGNLPFSTSDQELHELFTQQGSVVSAKVMTDRYTGRSRGFGFVEMSSCEEAQQAISAFNGTELGGRPMVVNEARPLEKKPPYGTRAQGADNPPSQERGTGSGTPDQIPDTELDPLPTSTQT